MPVPLPVMKVRCPQCKKIAILHFKSDVIMGMPVCKSCSVTMTIIGKMTWLDWITYPINVIRHL